MSRQLRSVAIVLVLVGILICLRATARDWYVAPNGNSTNDGSQQRPWDLKSTMRDGHGVVQPGDTIWLAAGTYTTAPAIQSDQRLFPCLISGEPGNPILFRAQPGARATIDGVVAPMAHDITFWGLEVANSNPRPADPANWAKFLFGGFYTEEANRCKIINCVVHDNGEGVVDWSETGNDEIYGCLIYHNGVAGSDRGHGHGVYVQGAGGEKRITDNVIWDSFDYGVHCFAEYGNEVNNVGIVGNIVFSNGLAATPEGCTNILVGTAGVPCRNILVSNNVSYMHPLAYRVNTKLFYTLLPSTHSLVEIKDPNENLVCTNNVFINGRYALSVGCWRTLVVTGNRLYAQSLASMMPIDTLRVGQAGSYVWNGNEYFLGANSKPFELGWAEKDSTQSIDTASWQSAKGFDGYSALHSGVAGRPKGVDVYVRPNVYEAGRAHIAVMNWDAQPTVAVDLSGVLKEGQPYRIFNVQKLWDTPVASGVYDGKDVVLPALLSSLAPEFDAYLVLPSAEGESR